MRERQSVLEGSRLIEESPSKPNAWRPWLLALALWLMVAGMASALLSGNLFAVGQMFAGPRATGSWIGIQNAIGNTAGIVGPIITGLIIDRLGDYGWAFAIAAAVSLCGAVWWLVGVPEVRPIEGAAA